MISRQFRCEWASAPGLEALTLGLAYGSWLCFASVCLVASFRPAGLSAPYWTAVPAVRTDTGGIAALLAGALCFAASEYLRLRRHQDGPPARRGPTGATGLVVRAISETVAIVATGLVIYVSVNSVTHPATLDLQAWHLAAWPTEGTVRVAALLLCVCSITVLRYLQTRPAPGRDAQTSVSSHWATAGRDHASRSEAVPRSGEANGSGPRNAAPAASAREGGSVPVIAW